MEKLGAQIGGAYRFDQKLSDGYFQIVGGVRYNFNQLNEGAFVGATYGLGLIDTGSTIHEIGSNAGYSIPAGPSSLNLSLGLA